ncbi:uncharacterized protein LOC132696760 [Cylas formicarius]|uniref:uncharacterized protein LOC132696760 n=1 Tax=Cylas formicarius TaxID=197179 RepID=UPI002958D646|nr:uncharacterized protein LOC132696760 [Cylas formicarius]
MEKEVHLIGNRLSQDDWFASNTLVYVFRYLDSTDLLRASRVCKLWHEIIDNPTFWQCVTIRESRLHFELMADFLSKQSTRHLRLIDCIFMLNTEFLIKALLKMPLLRKIEFSECSSLLIERLPEANCNLELINVNLIGGFGVHLDLGFVEKLPNIVDLRLNCNRDMISIESLCKLKKLNYLSITAVKNLNNLNLNVITKITSLKSIALGDCWNLDRDFGKDVLSKFNNLERLRLENCRECHLVQILESVSEMPKLKHLDLIGINVDNGFNKALAFCKNLRKLTIVPNPRRLKSADGNTKIKDGILQLKDDLHFLRWGFTPQYLSFISKMFEAENSVPFLLESNIPNDGAQLKIETIPLYELETMLTINMPKTNIRVVIFDPKWPNTT